MTLAETPSTGPPGPVLSIDDLVVTIGPDPMTPPIVDGVCLQVAPGEIVGLVGESGSGKSLTCMAALGLLKPPLRIAGSTVLNGVDLTLLSTKQRRSARAANAAMIFQEPMSALNPVMTVGAQIDEALRLRGQRDRGGRRRRTVELFEQVGIDDAPRRLRQYPHELSGGMCQRVMIAMALAAEPRVLIADEPTTALDVTIQAQILQLLRDLVAEAGMCMVLVTHDMGVVAETCDRVCVMYGGRIVESGPVSTVLASPAHPYSEALLRSTPTVDGERRRQSPIGGSVPTVDDMPGGCRFHPRCSLAVDRCATEVPPTSLSADHAVACWVRGDRS